MTDPVLVTPPAPRPLNWQMMLGWAGVVATGLGIFYLTTTQQGQRQLKPNRPRRPSRRSSRRKSSRRSSRRRSSRLRANRRYKALSKAARKRMPQSSFALPGKRYPIKGPPGSSRARDKAQAMRAISYLRMGRVASKADFLKVRSALIREYGVSFWKSNGGFGWEKVKSAKAKRRSKKRRTSRRMAANRRRSSRRRTSRRR
jgi:hypothetical protein